MRRRLQLACALVHDPELVFLDEPTAGIDPLVRQSIWRELHRLREAGRTLLITTQYVPEAEECDVVALIAEGRLIAFDTPEALRHLAFGGQLLEVETSDPIDVDRLQHGPRRRGRPAARAAAAAGAQPGLEDDRARVIAGVEAQSATVTSIHEARPSFDEVFALLVRGSQGSEDAVAGRGSRALGRRSKRPTHRRRGPADDVAGRPIASCPSPTATTPTATAEPTLPEALPEALSEPVAEIARGARGGRGPMNLARRPLRVLAVAGKETVEILRRPSALVSVVAGPVLILGLFGLGYLGQPPLRAELVIPSGSGLSSEPAAYTGLASDRVDIVGVTPDVATAREQLRAGAADIVVIAPADAQAELSQGRQAVMTVEYDTVSPYRAFIARTAADQLVAAVNSEVIATAAQRLADKAGEAGQSLPPELNPEVVAAPTRAEVTDLSPSAPNIVAFYGIMVLALIVQHTAITVSALSMLHDRRRGMFDLFRMSPIASGDLLTGKYAAFALLGTVVALAVLAVLVFGFGVPFLAGPGVVVGAVALLVLASIGIGIVVALVSDSDRQAVQVALLVLLASVFFSGLALDLDQFSAPVRAVSALLPVTQAGSLLQDLMLRGETTQAWRAIVLAAMAGILFVAGWLVLRRQLHRPA